MRQTYVSRPAQLRSRNLPCCFTTPAVSHGINRNGTFACRKDLIGILLTAVDTAVIVLVGLEENSYKETHYSLHLKQNLYTAKAGHKHQSA